VTCEPVVPQKNGQTANKIGWCFGSVWSQSFNYDAFGNIATSGTSSFQATYNPATNHFQILPSGTPAYDANGNVTNDGFNSYWWDAEGRNTKVGYSGYPITYDALGRWVEQYNGSGSGISRFI